MDRLRFAEGDLLSTRDGIIYDVKGIVHPVNRVIAFPRYIPDPSGFRESETHRYRKIYNLSERLRFLEQNFPHYLVHDSVFDETLCEIPLEDIEERYDPLTKLQELRRSKDLDELENLALEFAGFLQQHANVDLGTIGVSGSILVGLHTLESDVDLVVYGSSNCYAIWATLKSVMKYKNDFVRPYCLENLKKLFDFRSKDTSLKFKDFVRAEARKVLQGKFMERDYFIRFVKDWIEVDETYGDTQYKNVGYAKIRATITDDSESIFTPCTYYLKDVTVIEGPALSPITEIASFRGRFCEQATNEEAVIAQGKVERVTDTKHQVEYFRVLIGNKPSDYMALV